MSITERSQIVVRSELNLVGAEAINREISVTFGLHPLRVQRSLSRAAGGDQIVIGVAGRDRDIDRLLRAANISPVNRPEGYVIATTGLQTIVAGHDAAGAFYGAQTLCQLLYADSKGVHIPGVRVIDYPTLRYRGAHLFLGAHALPFHRKLIANIFARYKMNNLLLQCEQARWATTGKTAPAWAMSKDDLKADIAYARSHHLTVTPLVSSLGHVRWWLGDPRNRAMDEDPPTGKACRVDSPQTYQFFDRLFGEVLDTFHSPVLHIGGDEVSCSGRFPSLSRRTYPNVVSAYSAYVGRLHDRLARHHVRTGLWADMMLAPPEAVDGRNLPTVEVAEKMRATLPKDLILFDWHYAAQPSYQTPAILAKAGYRNIVGCTWNDPQAIQTMARTIAESGQMGLLQTTWAGYESKEQNLRTEKEQFALMIVAAEEAWNGGTVDVTRLPYNPDDVFDRAYRMAIDQPARAGSQAAQRNHG